MADPEDRAGLLAFLSLFLFPTMQKHGPKVHAPQGRTGKEQAAPA